MLKMRKKIVIFAISLLLLLINTVQCEKPTDANEEELPKNDGLKLEHEIVNKEQSDQPSSGESFVAWKNVGGVEELQPNMRSLYHMASTFLSQKFSLVAVISATREVVAGVRYNLLVNATDEAGEPTICAMQVFEKPWLTNEWGQKYKILETSNCTSAEETTTPMAFDDKTKYEVNPVFQHRNTEMTEDRLKDLEAQVITNFMKPSKKKFPKISAIVSTTTTPAPESTDISESVKESLDQLFMGTLDDNNQAVVVRKDVDAGQQQENRQEVVEELIVPKKVTKIWEEEKPNEQNETNKQADGEKFEVLASDEAKKPEEEPPTFETEVERALDEIFKSHMEIQEDLDEIAQHIAVKSDEPEEKYEPVFGHLEEQLDQFMANFYQKYGIDDSSVHVLAMSPYGPYDMPFIDVQGPMKPKITGAVAYFDDGRQIVRDTNFFANEDYEDLQQRRVPNTAEEIFDQSEIKNLLKRAAAAKTGTRSSSESEQSIDTETKQTVDQLAAVLNKDKEENRSENTSEETKKLPRVRRTASEQSAPSVPSAELVKSGIWKYSIKALAQLDEVDSDEYKRVLLDVLFAKKLAKTKDELRFFVKVKTGNSHCVEEIKSGTGNCDTNIVKGSHKICIMEIRLRNGDNLQVTKSECAPEVPRNKQSSCPGCTSPTGPEDAEAIVTMLKEAVAMLKTQESEADFELLRVVSSTQQVVAGIKYVIEAEFSNKGSNDVTKCTTTIWDRPWLPNGREIVFDCDENKKYTINKQNDRRKRSANDKSGSCVGCPRDTTAAEAAEVEDMVHDALVQLKGQVDGAELVLQKVISTKKQVVAGYRYTILAEFANKGATGDSFKCKVTIWDRPWLPDGRETSFDCDADKKYTVNKQTQRRKRATDSAVEVQGVSGPPCVGCPVATDASENEQIVKLVNEEVVKLNAQEDDVEINLSRVVSSTRQVVAGVKYVVHADFVNKNGTETFHCKVTVWERVWLPNSRQTTFECDENKVYTLNKQTSRKRRSMPMRHGHELTREEEKTRHLFKKFQLRHKKTYANNMEENVRYRIFKSNLFKIQQLNEREQGTAKYGVTEFADLTLAEFRQRTGLLPHHERHASHENEIRNAQAAIPELDEELPTEFDWREKGVITQVKNQGNCGSCWAFSVVGNIEGLNAIKTGQLEEFSEQELLDCDTIDKACGGGFMDQAYKALEQLGGLELESEYPYVAKKEKACHFNKTMSHVAVAGAVDLPKNETAMAQWLVKNGPISIGVNANAMQFYRGGISHPWHPLCSKKQLDHGVLIVGLGVKEYPMFKKTLPYWIIKNSWGPSWGEQGYYRLYRGDNSCGVSEMASSAVLA